MIFPFYDFYINTTEYSLSILNIFLNWYNKVVNEESYSFLVMTQLI